MKVLLFASSLCFAVSSAMAAEMRRIAPQAVVNLAGGCPPPRTDKLDFIPVIDPKTFEKKTIARFSRDVYLTPDCKETFDKNHRKPFQETPTWRDKKGKRK